jgi:curved DNA-binding protein CbpA
MTNPHEVLGLPPEADEAAIRERYLQLVREFPPDREPDRFAAIRAAYDELRDPGRLLSRRLFSSRSNDSFDALRAELVNRLRTARVGYEVLLTLAEGP